MRKVDQAGRVKALASGALDLGPGSGAITGRGLSAPSVNANAGSGNVDLTFTQPPAQVRVAASSGDVTVAVPANVSYAVDVSTSSGTQDVGVPTNPASHHVIHLTAGSGNVSVVPAPP